jgi:RNA 3'-phosphate cyclase
MGQDVVQLDGSAGEGGGQILRTSLALALLTGKAFHLRNVRANRSRPGLQPQHLTSVRAAATIGSAQIRGASKDSTDLVFEPGEVGPGEYHFSIGTAGATGLVLHTLYLPLALRATTPSEIIISGGTHVSNSPCFHFLDTTWRSYLALFGMQVALRMTRPGFYPRGGGELVARIEPCPRPCGFELDRCDPPSAVTCCSAVAGLPLEIAQRQAGRARQRLKSLGLKVTIDEENWPGGPGTMLAVTLNTTPAPTTFFALGARGKRAESVADEAVDQVSAFLRAQLAGVDAHSADQIVLPLALAPGPSRFPVAEVTRHLVTNVAVIRQFLHRDIQIHGDIGQSGTVNIA